MKPKVVVVLGPTSSGKSDLAVSLAKKFSGEIVSADSRQIYKGLDIGTGKVTRDKQFGEKLTSNSPYLHGGIVHHLLDVVGPKGSFSAMQYKALAEDAIQDISKRKRVPIIAGGTGFYIKAIVDDVVLPEVAPNRELRARLESASPQDLFRQLEELDLARAETIDKDNPRRLVRAIEIATQLGNVPPINTKFPKDYLAGKYEILQVGLLLEDKDLKQNITERTRERLENGWIAEVWDLLQTGVGWNRLEEFGLGYKCIMEHLQVKSSLENLEECIVSAEWQYAKRQKTWFKKDGRIKWFDIENKTGIEKTVEMFLKS